MQSIITPIFAPQTTPAAPAPTPSTPPVAQNAPGSSASAPSNLDPAIVALMHGIKTNEGANGNYTATGDNGTAAGIAMWSNENAQGVPQPLASGAIPANFQGMAKQYGLDPTDFSAANQNQVLYASLAADKQAGLSPEQILSKWNSGNPNAYLTNPVEKSGVSATGTQNVAAYVKNGMSAAQAYAAAQKANASWNSYTNPSGASNVGTGGSSGPSALQTIGGDISSGNLGGAAVEAGKSLLNFVFPTIGDIGGDINGTNTKTILQQVGDLGTTALGAIAIASMLPEAAVGAGAAGVLGMLTGADAESMAARIGIQAAGGAALGVTSALGQGDTNLGAIASSGAIGGATGGLVGGAAEAVGAISDSLPQRIVKSVLGKGVNDDTIDYAIQKGLGTPEKMLADSNASISSLGKTLGDALTHPQYDGITATAQDIIPNVISRFPNAGLDDDAVKAALQKVVPLQKTLVSKLFTDEGLSLDELHTLNSALGKNTFKTVFDDPVTKAGKELAGAFYNSASTYIKSEAPETAGLFDQLSKEYPLNKALVKATRNQATSKVFNLRDLMAIIAGGSTMGPVGAAAAYGGEQLLTSPAANMGAASLIGKMSGAGVGGVSTALTALGSRAAPNLATTLGVPSQ